MRPQTKKLTTLAILSAIAYLAMFLAKLLFPPIIPLLPFLTYDPKDIFIVFGGFIYGPLAAVIMSVIISFIEMITISTTGPIGLLMNIISTCAFAGTAAFIYKKKHSLMGAVIGLIAGWLAATAVMLLWNYFITPIYMGVPREAVAELLVPGFLPFNLLKYGLNAEFAMLFYKLLRRANILPAAEKIDATKGKINIGTVLVSVCVIITCILIILVFQGVI
jgi:riboflavin transporter FmnP